jgi:hypothetical protein
VIDVVTSTEFGFAMTDVWEGGWPYVTVRSVLSGCVGYAWTTPVVVFTM